MHSDMLPRAEARRVKRLPSVLGDRRSLSSLSHPLPVSDLENSLSLSFFLPLSLSVVPTLCPSVRLPLSFLSVSLLLPCELKVVREGEREKERPTTATRLVHSHDQLAHHVTTIPSSSALVDDGETRAHVTIRAG